MNNSAQKLSISLSQYDVNFLSNYQELHHYKSRSEVIQQALRLLQQQQLASEYREANQEIDSIWDVTVSDGLEEDETW